MPMRHEDISDVETLLTRTRKAYDEGALNVSKTVANKAKFKVDLNNVPWENFVLNADHSYFVARILLSQGVHLYGLFCAHQCVEVYLKAYLRRSNVPIPPVHRLQDLLAQSRTASSDLTEFIHTAHAETVCLRFEPFYEIARYPVRVSGPEDGKWFAGGGIDEKFLDYFVHQMRQTLALAPKSWDILSDQGHYYLHMVEELHPEFYSLFTNGNLNFRSGT